MTHFKYVVTAQKSTATHFVARGAFTGPHDMNLVLGKGNRIEIYTITPDGLKPTLESSIYGTIIALHLYHPHGQAQASLFLLTSRHKYCVLTMHNQQIITQYSGHVPLANSTPSTHSVMDPSYQIIATLLAPSTITLIMPSKTPPLQDDALLPSRKLASRKRQAALPPHYIHLPFPDKRIISMAFSSPTTLMVLYDDPMEKRYLQQFTVEEHTITEGPILMDHIEQDAHLLIALNHHHRHRGVLLISGQCIRYLAPDQPPIAIGITSATITCHAMITDTRLFLGNALGQLYLLELNTSGDRVHSLGFIELGNISLPSCLVYLGNDVLYVGSAKGDSQVVHVLGRDSIENNDILQVIETFPSLGPVVDFCVADLDKQGQPQLITCSGAGKDSSLRIIRSGVGLNQLAAIEMSGVKATWALRSGFYEKHTSILVISFFNATQLLQLENNTIAPLSSYSAIALDKRTLIAGNVIDDMLLQVTEHSLRLMEARPDGQLLDEWHDDLGGRRITVASLNPTQCVLSLGHGTLVTFSFEHRRLCKTGERTLDQEIACLDISPLDAPYLASAVVAVGVWQQVGVLLLSLPSLHEVVADEPLAGQIMPRSILMTRLEGLCYLLVGLGDGQTYNFRLGGKEGLWDKKRSFLGKLPIVLGTFSSNGMTHVFAASDKPSVIHSRNQKLVYSNVNLKEVRNVTSFNSPFFPDAVALTTREGVVIGQMEEIQKLHITKIPTLDTPRRIIYQEASRTFGVITEKMTSEPYTSQSTTGGFEVLDDQNFTVLDRIYFKQYERPLSAISTTFDQDENEYYVVATGRDSDAFETASSGRILVLRMHRHGNENRFALVSQIRTEGMVEQVAAFKGKLVASVHGKLHMYEWIQQQLTLVCSHTLATISEALVTQGNYIIAGDMIASVTVFRYESGQLEEVGADEAVREVTALAPLSDTLTVGAERDGHLFVVERDPLMAEEEEPLLETVSEWHLGEGVQRFQKGVLGGAAGANDPSSASSTSVLFATVNGAIGVMTDLAEDRFKLLWHMQNNMTKVVKSIGDLSHTDWRSVCTMDRNEESSHFIDGDLIESFLDLTPQQMQRVIDGHHGGKKLDHSIEDLCKVVEELMSLHS